MTSDSECNQFMSKALYFEDNGEEFDLSLPPTSGHEYLRRVQLEAQQCPNVMYAKIDQSHFASKQTVKINSGKGCLSAPLGYAPTESWQKSQIAHFADVRMTMSRYKAIRKQNNTTMELPEILPNILDDVGWCRFCFGNKEQKKDGAVSEDDDGVPPLLSVVTTMPQPLIEQVLDYHISWFETSGFTYRQGQWFYALLICLEKPLTPEACSSIRTLARLCANLRASLEKDDPILPPMNLLICLVSRYFDQTDLAD